MARCGCEPEPSEWREAGQPETFRTRREADTGYLSAIAIIFRISCPFLIMDVRQDGLGRSARGL